MSTFKVPYTEIKEIFPHPDPETISLEIAKVYDWSVVVRKGQYKTGDRVVYVPVDSILSQELETKLFPPDSKVKLHKRRIKSIKLRKHISQGMLIGLDDVGEQIGKVKLEDDVSEKLGITKYEPPAAELPRHMRIGQPKKKKPDNPNFSKYTDLENFKWYDRLFQTDEMIYVSEKLHGTAARYGWVKNEPTTLWKKILKFFNKLPEYEWVWGSRNVQIQVKGKHPGAKFEEQGVNFKDVYTKMIDQYNLKSVVPYGFCIYGEIVGDGIQGGYNYGCKSGEHKLFVYDVKGLTGAYLNYVDFKQFCEDHSLPVVPFVYFGPFRRDTIDLFLEGDSAVGGQKIKEGLVIKPMVEQSCSIGRKVLKYISSSYYLRKDNTDFH